jgi:CheY-like chemotaxis protein
MFLFVGLGWCEEDISGGIIDGGDQIKGKEHAPVDNKFLEAMTVLVVDDNPVCLKALEVFLCCCKYKCELEYTSPPFYQSIRINGHMIFISMATTTMMMEVRTSLNMLRDRGEEKFDLVVTNVHIPYMEGFDLLEFIILERDHPVIINYTLFL